MDPENNTTSATTDTNSTNSSHSHRPVTATASNLSLISSCDAQKILSSSPSPSSSRATKAAPPSSMTSPSATSPSTTSPSTTSSRRATCKFVCTFLVGTLLGGAVATALCILIIWLPNSSPSADAIVTFLNSSNSTSLSPQPPIDPTSYPYMNTTTPSVPPTRRVAKHYVSQAVKALLLWRPRGTGIATHAEEGYKLQRLAVRRLAGEDGSRTERWSGGGEAYQCQCQPGYAPQDAFKCVDIDECALPITCGQKCENSPGSYTCSCHAGFELNTDGSTCKDVNECASSGHGCSDMCENNYGSFQCVCPDGFHLQPDQRTCVSTYTGCSNSQFPCSDGRCVPIEWMCDDLPDCPNGEDEADVLCTDKCQCSDICKTIPRGFMCQCHSGRDLSSDLITCVDTDECATAQHNCSHTCINTPGSYKCACPPVMYLAQDGSTCLEGPCTRGQHNCSHVCMTNGPGFTCACPQHLTLLADGATCGCNDNEFTCNDGSCIPVDWRCDGIKDCEPNYEDEAEYECSKGCIAGQFQCNDGTCINGDWTCDGINDCVPNFEDEAPSTCQSNAPNPCDAGGCSHTCTSVGDTFYCSCPQNYILMPDRKTCKRFDPSTDVNECELDNGGCSYLCENTEGSFICLCPDGWKLTANGKNCVEKVCLKNSGGCSHDCTDTDTGFYCSCPLGIELGPDGKTCQTCEEGEFQCSGLERKCIPLKYLCDFYQDCTLTGDDEAPERCGNAAGCPDNKFQCPNRKCIPQEWVCDKIRDCNESSSSSADEADCPKAPPHPCDINKGGCSHTCQRNGADFTCTCPDDKFLADNERECIQRFSLPIIHLGITTAVYRVLWQGYLAIACVIPVTPPITGAADRVTWWFKNGTTTRQVLNDTDGNIITTDQVTDYGFAFSMLMRKGMGPLDTGSYSCELSMDHIKLTNSTQVHVLINFVCNESLYTTCPGSRRCLDWSCHCNGVSECLDNSDEAKCVKSCEPHQFHCGYLSECIPKSKQCDGVINCLDQSDEANCENIVFCGDGEFQCNNKVCITLDERCDGKIECEDGSDEFDCVTARSHTLNGVAYLLPLAYHRGEHGAEQLPVCADSWSAQWSEVVCNQLGYGSERGWESVQRGSLPADTGVAISAGFASHSGSGTPITRLHQQLNFQKECSDDRVVLIQCRIKQCGIRPALRVASPFIVGGDDAAEGVAPWQVQIRLYGDLLCGGTLIHPQWVLTAAHCADYSRIPSDYNIRLGTNLRTGQSPTLVNSAITLFRSHENYDKRTNRNDIALIKLARPVTLNNNLMPACLPDKYYDPAKSRGCQVTGWGATDGFFPQVKPENLQHASFSVVDAKRCTDSKRVVHRDGNFSIVYPESMLCAGYSHGSASACTGDSGGPFVCQGENHIWSVVGIVSWGNGICNTFSVFTKVTNYLDWIENTMNLYS